MTTPQLSAKATEFVTIDDEIKALQTRMEALKKRKAELEEPLLESMMDAGVENVRLTGADLAATLSTLDENQSKLYYELLNIIMAGDWVDGNDVQDVVDVLEALRTNIVAVNASHRRTLYIYTQWWATIEKDETTGQPKTEAALRALRDAGLYDFVRETFNTQTLSSWIREQERSPSGEPLLPRAFDGAIRATQRTTLRARKV